MHGRLIASAATRSTRRTLELAAAGTASARPVHPSCLVGSQNDGSGRSPRRRCRHDARCVRSAPCWRSCSSRVRFSPGGGMLMSRWRSLRCRITGHRTLGLRWSETWQSYLQTCARCGQVAEFTPQFSGRSRTYPDLPEGPYNQLPGYLDEALRRGTAAPEATPPASTPPPDLRSGSGTGGVARYGWHWTVDRCQLPSSTGASADTDGSSTSTQPPSHGWHPSIADSSRSR
jgi:hypothetical protein